jgi:RNA polymerase sigma factor
MLCKDDTKNINSLIEKYKPFIFETTHKIEREYNFSNDELSTVGMMAFKEAIEKYDKSKGNFFTFAKLVIKSRATDYLRKIKSVRDREKLIINDNEDNESVNIIERFTFENYDESNINELRRLEIEEIKGCLRDFDIEFEDIVINSPKKGKLKNLYTYIAKYASQDEEIMRKFLSNRRLPIKEICLEFKNQRKKIERGRKYIIFLILVLTGDFPMIRSYIGMEVQE